MQLRPTPKFEKAFGKLGSELQLLTAATIKSLIQDRDAGRLHFKRLKGTDYWSARVDGNYRVVMRQLALDEFEIIDVCPHGTYDRRYG